jgi:hypothetical protein
MARDDEIVRSTMQNPGRLRVFNRGDGFAVAFARAGDAIAAAVGARSRALLVIGHDGQRPQRLRQCRIGPGSAAPSEPPDIQDHVEFVRTQR